MTVRLSYRPHSGHTVCGSVVWPRSQVVSAGGVAFHCARRARVLLRDILRFGTAITSPRSFACPAGLLAPTSERRALRAHGPPAGRPAALRTRRRALHTPPGTAG